MDYLDFKSIKDESGQSRTDCYRTALFAASVIKGVAPNDHLVAMQVAQMAVMHWATMQYMRQVASHRGTEQQEFAVAAATKLARTFSTQLDALKRYRAGGQQNVTVRHVLVNEGRRAAM